MLRRILILIFSCSIKLLFGQDVGASCMEWRSEDTKAFLKLLEEVTSSTSPVWASYNLAKPVVVLYVEDSVNSSYCLGAWSGGRNIGFKESIVSPKLLTPLYGYYFSFQNLKKDADSATASIGYQPLAIKNWLDEIGVSTAIIMPVVPNFPIKLPARTKVITAIHEAFHVEVQFRYWLTGIGVWPAWDRQPDRNSVSDCYSYSDSVYKKLLVERGYLLELVNALLDERKMDACQAAEDFLEARLKRYEMLNQVSVSQFDGREGSCSMSEAIMELEEGTAVFVSWTALYNQGVVDREALIERYGAVQEELFYLTGAMQLHALTLMNENNILKVSRNIASTSDPIEGSLTNLLRENINKYCK